LADRIHKKYLGIYNQQTKPLLKKTHEHLLRKTSTHSQLKYWNIYLPHFLNTTVNFQCLY